MNRCARILTSPSGVNTPGGNDGGPCGVQGSTTTPCTCSRRYSKRLPMRLVDLLFGHSHPPVAVHQRQHIAGDGVPAEE